MKFNYSFEIIDWTKNFFKNNELFIGIKIRKEYF